MYLDVIGQLRFGHPLAVERPTTTSPSSTSGR